MNRWTDLLASFGMATLLHGLLVLGAVWFWTLRPPELRPMFQSGDVSLAVTFVAAGEARGAWSVERGATTDSGSRKPEPADILTDPETEMPEDRNQTTDDGRQTSLRPRATPWQATDAAAESPPEEEEDQDMLDSETVAPVSAQASANAPEDGLPTDLSTVVPTLREVGTKEEAPGAKAGRQTPLRDQATPERYAQARTATAGQATDSAAEPPSDALRQGVNGAVRMQSEIRPYYPLGARLRGEEGAVTVRVWVNSSGRALRCEVARSSGYPVLDEAAVDAARRARYVSTRPGAWRAEVETTLTFRFQLTE